MSFIKRTLSATIKTSLIVTSLTIPFLAQAKDITVEITNLTNGIYFTPLLVAAHSHDLDFYELGEEASEHLQAMAEGGNISGLSADAHEADADVVENPAGGLLAPGESTSAEFKRLNHKNKFLSVTAMLLPTNDAFVGIDSIPIPRKRGTYTYYLNGNDAGTEANDEIINGGGMPNSPGIPAAPGEDGGINATGVTMDEANQTVHIHRGVIGDHEPDGGISDLDSAIHRWLNPVAKMVITVGCRKSHFYDPRCR